MGWMVEQVFVLIRPLQTPWHRLARVNRGWAIDPIGERDEITRRANVQIAIARLVTLRARIHQTPPAECSPSDTP